MLFSLKYQPDTNLQLYPVYTFIDWMIVGCFTTSRKYFMHNQDDAFMIEIFDLGVAHPPSIWQPKAITMKEDQNVKC